MLWFILAIIIAIYAAILNKELYIGLVLMVGGFFIALMINGLWSFSPEEKVDSDSYSIASLKDGSSTSGSFFLGIGSFDEGMKYSFYGENPDGSYGLKSVDVDEATVRFIDDGNPRYTMKCYAETNPSILFSFFNSSEDCDTDYGVTFYVPRGTIKNEFVLDAE